MIWFLYIFKRIFKQREKQFRSRHPIKSEKKGIFALINFLYYFKINFPTSVIYL